MAGGYLPEEFDDANQYYCRLLVGMQRLSEDELKAFFSGEDKQLVDNATALELKRKIAQQFKDQLIIGSPTNEDEKTPKRLAKYDS